MPLAINSMLGAAIAEPQLSKHMRKHIYAAFFFRCCSSSRKLSSSRRCCSLISRGSRTFNTTYWSPWCTSSAILHKQPFLLGLKLLMISSDHHNLERSRTSCSTLPIIHLSWLSIGSDSIRVSFLAVFQHSRRALLHSALMTLPEPLMWACCATNNQRRRTHGFLWVPGGFHLGVTGDSAHLAGGIVHVGNAVAAHAQAIARLRARPHPHIRLTLKRRHPARIRDTT